MSVQNDEILHTITVDLNDISDLTSLFDSIKDDEVPVQYSVQAAETVEKENQICTDVSKREGKNKSLIATNSRKHRVNSNYNKNQRAEKKFSQNKSKIQNIETIPKSALGKTDTPVFVACCSLDRPLRLEQFMAHVWQDKCTKYKPTGDYLRQNAFNEMSLQIQQLFTKVETLEKENAKMEKEREDFIAKEAELELNYKVSQLELNELKDPKYTDAIKLQIQKELKDQHSDELKSLVTGYSEEIDNYKSKLSALKNMVVNFN